jgi:hypothetical protein
MFDNDNRFKKQEFIQLCDALIRARNIVFVELSCHQMNRDVLQTLRTLMHSKRDLAMTLIIDDADFSLQEQFAEAIGSSFTLHYLFFHWYVANRMEMIKIIEPLIRKNTFIRDGCIIGNSYSMSYFIERNKKRYQKSVEAAVVLLAIKKCRPETKLSMLVKDTMVILAKALVDTYGDAEAWTLSEQSLMLEEGERVVKKIKLT